MSRSTVSPLYHVHAEALAAEQVGPPVPHRAPAPVTVEDWQAALQLSEVVVHLEEEEFAEAPPDPTFADTEGALIDASATEVASARIF